MARTLVALCVLTLLSGGAAYAAGGGPAPVASFFIFELNGSSLLRISKCGPIGSETEVIEVTNGSGIVSKVPGKTTYPNIVCTETVTADTTLANWRHDAEVGSLTRLDGKITLLDSALNQVTVINFLNSWPSSLFINGLDASSSAPITETVSIVVDRLDRQ